MAPVFRVGAHIGSGGFGSVEEAVRIDDDGNVIEDGLAQKKLLPQFEGDQEAVARFRREVRYLGEMEHPHVIPVVGRNLSASPPWFVMPKAECTLRDQLAPHSGDVGWITKTFTAVLEAMAYAHGARRVVHRDLKPENVLIVGGVPMVSDFGLGKRLDADTTRLTSTNIAMGTLAYMAPEQFRDAAHVGMAADIYALGKILGEMLSGKFPDIGRPRLEDFPVAFRGFIDRCTKDTPNDRYASGTDALAAFQLLVTGSGAVGETGEDIDDLIKKWEAKPFGSDAAEVEAIVGYLLARREDEEFYFRIVPRLPQDFVSQLVDERLGDFELILTAYNGHIEGGLPFDYCDVVANFYRHVFLASDDLGVRELVFDRLFELGPSHNRWHVGEVVGELLTGLDDQPTIAMVSEIVRAHPRAARWHEEYIDGVELPAEVKAAFDLQRPRSADGEIPF
jgi:eukaryotic-like serine/threonine-protein kinase